MLATGLVASAAYANPSSSSTTVPSTTSTTVPFTKLQLGSVGPAVLALQLKLAQTGYWIGNANGHFTDLTQQAVYALQKANGLTRDGVVNRWTAAALDRAVLPTPVTTTGLVLEISLSKQILMIVQDHRVVKIFNISSGGGYSYATAEGFKTNAITPTGTFHVYYQVNKWDIGPLGGLYRPKYFTGGIAVHGSYLVPPTPASHGCIRVSLAAMDWLWASPYIPMGTRVVVYK
jgi:peptidoglycan hydrolase-like protein with peptidoglycan-binding domain